MKLLIADGIKTTVRTIWRCCSSRLAIRTIMVITIMAVRLHAQTPTIFALSPPGVAQGSPGFSLHVIGPSFTSGAVVRWNGQNRPTVLVSSNELLAGISAADVAGLSSASITVSNGGVSNSLGFVVYQRLDQSTNDLAYDRVSRRIYASLSGATLNGNAIVSIDPVTGTSASPVWVGSEPGKLAVSDDGHYLYVALDGAAAVRRFDLNTQTPDLQFGLGAAAFSGPYFVRDMEVLPGNPSAIAVSRWLPSASSGGLVGIFDNGVQRPTQATGFNSDAITFSASSSEPYGYDKNSSRFAKMSVDASGVTVAQTAAIDFKGATDIKFDNGLVFATSGVVVDPQTLTVAGTYPVTDFHANAVVPDSSLGLVFYLSVDNAVAYIDVFSLQNGAYRGFLAFSGIVGNVSSLVRWGEDGLAFRDDSQVFTFRVPPTWPLYLPPLSISPRSVVFSSQGVMNAAISLTNNTGGAIAISNVATTGDFAAVNNCGSAVAASSTCTIGITFNPTAQGTRYGVLTIADGTVNSPHIVGLTGISGTPNPIPSITSLSPASAAMGSPGFTLTVSGGNFAQGSVVRWNGLTRATQFVNSTTLTATIPASDLEGLDSVSITVFNPLPDGGTSHTAGFPVYRSLSIPTKDLTYDRTTGNIYASIPGRASGGNSIRKINPFTATIGPSIFVGSEPGKLTVSDDGQYMYVSLDGAAAVRRFDLHSQTAGLQFSLGSNSSFGPYNVDDMQVVPGNPLSLAVARKTTLSSGATGGTVAIYDDGVKRNVETSTNVASQVTFSDSASPLYGSISSSPSQFVTMSSDQSGVAVIKTTNGLPIAGGITYDSGRVYASTGAALDPVAHALTGTFVLPSHFLSKSAVPDGPRNTMFFLTQSSIDSSVAQICTFEKSTFRLRGCLSVPVGGATLTSLVRWGDDGLAFRADNDQIYLLRIPGGWLTAKPTLSVSPSSFAFPVQTVGTTSGSRTVRLTNNSGLPVTISSVAVTGDFAQTSGCGSVIAALSTCTISVTFSPTMPGTRSGMLTIVDDTAAGPHIVGLSGIGNGSNPIPSIASISPTDAAVGSPGFTLTVNGTNFISGSVVRWNGQNRPTTVLNGTTVTASIPAGDVSAIGTPTITVFNPLPDGGTSNMAAFTVYRALNLSTNDILFERSTSRIYASIPTSAPNGNSIIPIDPVSATTGLPISIGFEPERLAASDNGQYLYVSQRFGGNIRRIDLPSQSAGSQFGLGSDQSGTLGVYDMQVTPGNSSALAVAHNHLTNSGRGPVRIYDDGVNRAVDTGGNSGSLAIAFSNGPATLYGVDDNSGFRTMSVDSSGVAVTNAAKMPVGPQDLKFANGLVYSSSGAVIQGSAHTLAGMFQLQGSSFYISVVSDSTLNLVFFMASGVISVYNRFDYTLVGTLTVSAGSAFTNPRLQRWGDDGLAFRTDTKVFLLRIPSGWAVPAPPRRPAQITSQ